MKKIYKYPITMAIQQVIELPLGSRIVDAAFQDQTPCIWVLFDDLMEETKQPVTISIYGTGHAIWDETPCYIKTVHIDEFVWHFFCSPML